MGSEADVNKAVVAAKKAFPAWSRTSKEERLAYLDKLLAAYEKRTAEMARTISQEMGAPITLATQAQAASGWGSTSRPSSAPSRRSSSTAR